MTSHIECNAPPPRLRDQLSLVTSLVAYWPFLITIFRALPACQSSLPSLGRRGEVRHSELIRYLGLGSQNIVQRHDPDRRAILVGDQN